MLPALHDITKHGSEGVKNCWIQNQQQHLCCMFLQSWL